MQPIAALVKSGGAEFRVVASSAEPGTLYYQWRRDGNEIAGAVGAELYLVAPTPADSGANFDVVVSNAFGAVTSDVATLEVL